MLIHLLELQNTPHLPHGYHRFVEHFISPLHLLHRHLTRLLHFLIGHLLHQNQLHSQIEYFIHLQFQRLLNHHLDHQIQILTRFILQFRLILLIQFERIFHFFSFIWREPFCVQVNLLLFFLLILLLVYFILLIKSSMLFSFLLQV